MHRRGRLADKEPLDDEEQGNDTADRDRQIGHADRQLRELRDRLMPGGSDEPGAPDDHEQAQ
jgi:hypothetical protein